MSLSNQPHSNAFALRDERGQVFLRIGLSATLYFERGTSAEKRMHVAKCFNLFRRIADRNLRFMTNLSGDSWRRINERRILKFNEFLQSSMPEISSWNFSCQGGMNAHEASEFQFNVFATGFERSLSYLQMILPMSWLTTPQGSFRDLVIDVCKILQPYHGYGGFAFIESSDIELEYYGQPLVYALARRFPGIEVDRPLVHLSHLNAGIKSVNWLTVLCLRWVDKMGGLAALRRILPTTFVFHDLGASLIIQAGSRPQIGDRNQQLWPALYAQLARTLRPIRIKHHGCFDYAGRNRFTSDTSLEWLMRFDRDPW